MKKKICIGILCVLGGLLAITGYAFVQTMNRANAFSFSKINMETISDGTYDGSCDAMLVVVDVQVQVSDHKMINIDLRNHQNGFGKDAEVILDAMVQANTSDVDMISGATISSKTMRCAVEHALLGTNTRNIKKNKT